MPAQLHYVSPLKSVREEAEVDPLIAIAERRAAARSGGPAFDVSGEDAGQRRIADGHDDHRYSASTRGRIKFGWKSTAPKDVTKSTTGRWLRHTLPARMVGLRPLGS